MKRAAIPLGISCRQTQALPVIESLTGLHGIAQTSLRSPLRAALIGGVRWGRRRLFHLLSLKACREGSSPFEAND